MNDSKPEAEPKTGLQIAEYEMLREELSESKRYVFERPIALVVIAGVLLGVERTELFPFLPPIVVAVLTFNLWFTINRLESGARIVGYLSVCHEPRGIGRWIGWENSLELYRKHDKKEQGGSPSSDRLHFYKAILILHGTFVVLPTLALFYLALQRMELLADVGVIAAIGSTMPISAVNEQVDSKYIYAASILCAAFASAFTYVVVKWPPADMNRLIPDEKATWVAVAKNPDNDMLRAGPVSVVDDQ